MGSRTVPERSLLRHSIVGLASITFLLSGIGVWAATTDISGAVVAAGMLVVDSNVKKVQHPTGGVVGALMVRDGAAVKAGDIVIRLDDTVMRANLAIITKSLDELDARQARLKAERDDLGSISFSKDLVSRSTASQIREMIEEEQKLFDMRRSARNGQQSQLRERINQFQDELKGLASQADAKAKEIQFIQKELDGVRHLWEKKLIPMTRLMTLEREGARIEGERGHLLAGSAQTKGKITEIELQIGQIDRDLKSEASKELREVQAKIAELVERRVAAEDQLKRTDIIAPQDGVVHQLSVHTVGGVVSPGEQLMLIVPGADELTAEVRIAPHDIDQLTIGQRAVLRFAAFNQRTTPEIAGRLKIVSADITQGRKPEPPIISAGSASRLKKLRD